MEDENKEELEINKQNREDYENLMKKSGVKKDDYWDKNDPVVKIILLSLGVFIILGVLFYLFSYLGS